jgi:hypothetical protein
MVKTKDSGGNQMLRIMGQVLPRLPFLVLRMGRMYVSFKRQVKRSSQVFEKELRRQGMDKQMAAALTQQYLASSHLSHMLRNVQSM